MILMIETLLTMSLPTTQKRKKGKDLQLPLLQALPLYEERKGKRFNFE